MSIPVPSDVVRACVVSGELNTHYYRAGRGQPVLVLIADNSLLWSVLATMPRHVRALAPEPPRAVLASDRAIDRDTGAFAAWVRSFLDALGLQQTAVIADAAFAPAALGFARADQERVSRLVLLQRGSRDAPQSVWGITGQHVAEPALLVAWLPAKSETGIEHLVSHIVDFIGGQVPDAGGEQSRT